jgi:hypothetical protein
MTKQQPRLMNVCALSSWLENDPPLKPLAATLVLVLIARENPFELHLNEKIIRRRDGETQRTIYKLRSRRGECCSE